MAANSFSSMSDRDNLAVGGNYGTDVQMFIEQPRQLARVRVESTTISFVEEDLRGSVACRDAGPELHEKVDEHRRDRALLATMSGMSGE